MNQSITETTMGLDIEAIEHLDFEFEPPCEHTKGCDHVAVWRFTLLCCGASKVMCDMHATKERLFYLINADSKCDCVNCGQVGLPSDLVLWEKL